MSKKLLSTLIASLFAAAPALAQSTDPMRVEGSATLGGIYNDQNVQDPTKLEEYQDLRNGAMSNIGVRGRNSTSWFTGYGENFGRSDQYMFMRGGMYDFFKGGAYLNDIPHNFLTSGLTPYYGPPGNVLTAPFPNTNSNTWNGVNLGYDRRDWGGFFEWQKNSPWYFRADGNQVTFNGTKVGSAASGTSPGNGFVDLAIPTQYTTNNWGAEGGYQSGKATFALRWDYSQFDNSIKTLDWTNPFFGGNKLDTSYLPPDNTFNKFTATASYRDLPWRSVISARYTWAETKSDFGLAPLALNTGSTYAATLPQESSFNGQNTNQSFALSWTAVPMTNVDTRVYYYWSKLENGSDVVEFGNAPTQPLTSGLGCGNFQVNGVPTQTVGNCENELYNYTKNNVGFDVWWRFLKGQRLGFGYDYNNLDQTRVDYDKAHWNRLWVEYKNTMLDTVSGRLKYQYLKRDATLNFSNAGLTADNPNYLLPYTSAFDLQSSTTNQVKLYLDYNPMANLGLAFEGNWAKQDYDDVTYGRTSSERQGYFLSGNWGDASKLMLSAFGSWEETKYPSGHRYIGTVAGGPNPPAGYCTAANPNCYSPSCLPEFRFVQLELGDQGSDLYDRCRAGLAGHAEPDAEGVVPVHTERRRRDLRVAGRDRRNGRRPCRLRQPAQHRQLRQFEAAVLQPEGDLRVEQELVVHGRLRVREVRPQRHRHQRLPVHAALCRCGDADSQPELPERLRRVHQRHAEHLLPAGDVQARRAAAADRPAEGRGSAAQGSTPAAPAAPAAARTGSGPAGAEDHARLEGPVRLRQGSAQA